MNQKKTFCVQCDAELEHDARLCYRCGAAVPKRERPVAIIIFVSVCILAAVFIAYMLAFNSGTKQERPGVMLTLTELGVVVPNGWHYRDLSGTYLMAQYNEDLDVDEPDELRGPQIRITREKQARTNVTREVMRGVQPGDTAGQVKEATYGKASELIGSEVRFEREGLSNDIAGYRYYMTGSNPLGQAYVISYFVPATLEQKYDRTLKTFLASLELSSDEPDTE